jgi:ArsR family transcriptional regulator, virulence genes transcriptional regulator
MAGRAAGATARTTTRTTTRSAAPSASAGKRTGGKAAGLTGPAHPSRDYASAASLFRALSHPLRVKLVCGLLREPLSQTAIARVLGLSQSLVAQHLAVLRRAGIVRGRRVGGEVVLDISDRRLPKIFGAVCGTPAGFLPKDWTSLREKKPAKRNDHPEGS